MSPQAYADAAGGGGTLILANTETLPQAAHRWFDSMPPPQAAAEQVDTPGPPWTKPWTDPASAALYHAVVGWPLIAMGMDMVRTSAAEALVSWVDNLTTVFPVSDHSGASRISNADGPMRV
ncbi:MAG: hypothetical protein J2P17_04125 [Mycobacterium sp.]|nr:hypothetical protein [Mycobacterium sp.]